MTESNAFSPEEELAYWRTLASERGIELETLRHRVIELGEAHPSIPVAAFVASAGGAGWLRELDRIGRSPRLQSSNVMEILGDLWARVARDRDEPRER